MGKRKRTYRVTGGAPVKHDGRRIMPGEEFKAYPDKVGRLLSNRNITEQKEERSDG
jgi:hypothetical protein